MTPCALSPQMMFASTLTFFIQYNIQPEGQCTEERQCCWYNVLFYSVM